MNTTWMKPKPAKSLGHALRRAAFRAVMVTAALVLGYSVSTMVQPSSIVFPEQQAPATAAPQPTQAERLVERHGCWTGEAPADMVGVIPGHVVVVKDGQAVYGADRLVGQALGQAFDGEDHGLQIIAFCR